MNITGVVLHIHANSDVHRSAKEETSIQNPESKKRILDFGSPCNRHTPRIQKKDFGFWIIRLDTQHWVWKMKVCLTAEKQAELRRLYNYNNQMHVKDLKSINTLINHTSWHASERRQPMENLQHCLYCIDKEAERMTTEFSSQDELSWVMSGVRVLGIKLNEWQRVVPDFKFFCCSDFQKSSFKGTIMNFLNHQWHSLNGRDWLAGGPVPLTVKH